MSKACYKATFIFVLIAISPLLPAQQAMSGKALYEQSCLVCHGEDGDGAMPGVADMTGKNGPLKQPTRELMKSIRQGVQKEGAAMAMPPLGGNPQLTDSDIEKIIQYMRKHF